MRWLLLRVLDLYQKVFSLFSHGSCRYYPTCSEYARWRIEQDSLPLALGATLFRLMRCNPFFAGGIEYPVVKKEFSNPLHKKIKVRYWFVPAGKKRSYFLVKNLF